ncbi:MAG: AI-2E family transporter [Lachnospirales bacterium]
MKKFNKNHVQIAILAVISVCIIIIFNEFSEQAASVFQNIINIIIDSVVVIKPLFIGIFMAVMINPILKYIEKRIIKPKMSNFSNRTVRYVSLITCYVLILSVFYIIIMTVLPDVLLSVTKIISGIPTNAEEFTYLVENSFLSETLTGIYGFTDQLDKLLSGYEVNFNDTITSIFTYFTDRIFNTLTKIPYLFDLVIQNAINITRGVFQLIISLMLSFYILSDKEYFARNLKTFLENIMGESKSVFLFEIVYTANDVFEKFFIGKIIDSLIIGTMFYVITWLAGFENVGLNSLIIAVTNMIPYFGPFIGAVPVVLISLPQGMGVALWTSLIILALQQFDGWILGPKILSESTGLKPITIIVAILIGGKVAGPIGMFLAVPFFTVAIIIFARVIEMRRGNVYDPAGEPINDEEV